ncbi:hypothetical protein SAMN02982919_02552 [Giesbergeria anulus]|uniref:Uncharacterized protein n=1 Tax=Giesbergeria anulus TaxID=180197 RepID=A0A1H9PX56_9BURK|nr:hypothetical protein SAMN02982919_02552 [Giesbergeria anulus]
MCRCLGIFFLLLSFFWQAVAVAGQIPAFASTEEREHAVLHLQEAGHHHKDGAVSIDQSSDSVLHLVSDSLPSASLDTSLSSVFVPDWTSASPLEWVTAKLPYPILEGPRRPPKHIA